MSVHIGQAGVQLGSACWELYGIEHGISPDGYLSSETTKCSSIDFFDAFYQESSSGKHTPRAILIDLEPSVISKKILYLTT